MPGSAPFPRVLVRHSNYFAVGRISLLRSLSSPFLSLTLALSIARSLYRSLAPTLVSSLAPSLVSSLSLLFLSPLSSLSLPFYLSLSLSLSRMQGVSMMSCRRNLKKEKRVRNEACARQYRKAPKSRFRCAYVALCCIVLHCVAVCCIVLHCVAL